MSCQTTFRSDGVAVITEVDELKEDHEDETLQVLNSFPNNHTKVRTTRTPEDKRT